MSPESKQLLIRNKDSELFIGPLPHPEVLREYNELVPTSAERILSMVEQDARNEIAREKRAQVFAFAISVLIVCGAVACAVTGHEKAACFLAGATLLGVVSSFLGRRSPPEK
jgi:uncharacterized membrane protein